MFCVARSIPLSPREMSPPAQLLDRRAKGGGDEYRKRLLSARRSRSQFLRQVVAREVCTALRKRGTRPRVGAASGPQVDARAHRLESFLALVAHALRTPACIDERDERDRRRWTASPIQARNKVEERERGMSGNTRTSPSNRPRKRICREDVRPQHASVCCPWSALKLQPGAPPQTLVCGTNAGPCRSGAPVVPRTLVSTVLRPH